MLLLKKEMDSFYKTNCKIAYPWGKECLLSSFSSCLIFTDFQVTTLIRMYVKIARKSSARCMLVDVYFAFSMLSRFSETL